MTASISIINHTTIRTSQTFFSNIQDAGVLVNIKNVNVFIIFAVNSTIETVFTIPQRYTGNPVILLEGFFTGGTPSGTFAASVEIIQVLEGESIDVSYETKVTASNSVWTIGEADLYTLAVNLTPSVALVSGATLFVKFYRDSGLDDLPNSFVLTDMKFQYAEMG